MSVRDFLPCLISAIAGLDQATIPLAGSLPLGHGPRVANRPRRRSAEAIPDVPRQSRSDPGQVLVTEGPTALRASP